MRSFYPQMRFVAWELIYFEITELPGVKPNLACVQTNGFVNSQRF